MANLSLYNIAQEHRAMVEHLMNTQEDMQAIQDTIEAESYPIEQKAQNVAYAIKNISATAEAIKAAEKEMSERRKALEKREEHLREYLKTCLEMAGIQKIECPHFAMTIKKNPPSIDVFEAGLIPAEYMKAPEPPPPLPDKVLIKQAISEGKEVPGAKLVQGSRLEIR